MRIAVLADLHANLHAIEAVEARLTEVAPDAIVVLGDVVGYNAMPEATVQWLRDKDPWVVAGNHDRELDRARPRLGTRAAARAAQAWTREQLSDESLTYLRGLPNRHVESSEFVAVHGCYLNDEHT
jgi:predicted phosphodiesterase